MMNVMMIIVIVIFMIIVIVMFMMIVILIGDIDDWDDNYCYCDDVYDSFDMMHHMIIWAAFVILIIFCPFCIIKSQNF